MVRIPTGTLVNALVDSCGGHVEWCKAVLIGGGTAVGWVRVIQPDDPSPALKVLVGKVFHAPWHNIEAHVEGLAEKGGRRDRDCKKLDDEMDLLSIETKSVAACRLLLEVETNQSYESMKPDDSSYLHAAMELVEEVVDKVRGVRRSLYPDGSEGDARGSK
ncbi:MAG: hypothetical protein HY287_00655 [Planctomycetes bacterium]|nr:hypothetical protein [Planctomycetota bacterium]